jgi:tetratricopeptide (TPR) repeat protein
MKSLKIILPLAAILVAAILGLAPAAQAAGRDVTDEVKARIAALNLKPRTMELTSEKALRARNAIKQDDFATADKIIATALQQSRVETWRFFPLGDLIDAIPDVNDKDFEAHLAAWVARNENDSMPLLVRATFLQSKAWLERGSNFVSETPAARMAAFGTLIERSRADVEASIRLDGGNPYSFQLWLKILRGKGFTDEMIRAFEAGIAKYPGYYPLYPAMLVVLQPKWGGSTEAMYAFVDRYAGEAPEGSALKLLHVALYRYLLETAATGCNEFWRDKDKMTACTASGMQAVVTKDLERKVVDALHLYDRFDKYQFSTTLEQPLSNMLKTGGGEHYTGAMLELAASSLHSDTQLKQDKPGSNNNYVIDMLVAESWSRKGFYDNAVQKDEEALRDIESMPFPGEEEKYLAIAGVYEHMADLANKLHRYVDMVAYEEAAIAIGNKIGQDHGVCFAYYQLKDYDNAVRSCTRAIDRWPGNLPAHYWRGVASSDKGDADPAARDLTVVAESEHLFRSSAALALSMVHFRRNDNASALDVLNRYKYLYDPAATSKQDIAVSYNNRCYAYMQLGELRAALDDCTASLKYGAIPDAFSKQRELMKQLSASATGK